jgi:uncharacterized protein
MKSSSEIKDIIRQNIGLLKEKYYIKNIGLFGSVVRGENNVNSDIDILVEFDKPLGLIKFMEIEELLSGLLEGKVDLVMKDSLKPRIGEHILHEVVML